MRLITVNNHKIKNFTHYYVLNMTNYDVELGIRRAWPACRKQIMLSTASTTINLKLATAEIFDVHTKHLYTSLL